MLCECVGPGPQPRAERAAERDRHGIAGAVVVPSDHVDDLVERARDEVGELVLHDRAQTVQRRAGGQAGEARTRRSGVSTTRRAPNRSRNPLVTLKAPPNWPTSSPIRKTFSSASISAPSAKETRRGSSPSVGLARGAC